MTSKEDRSSDLAIAQVANQIIKVPMDDFLHENYLPFSYYVIRNRSLVSVDGLKPVNRRILYSMYKQKLFPSASYTKAQMIVGNVMGFYHPHGDSGISGGLSHMAQTFNTRVPLIDPHGSVGKTTGDRAAADRYWEARLTKAAMELLKELDDKALPMGRNYDDSLDEPMVLPVRWPTTIINGTEGIAVGYASTIFPNNPTEAMDVAIALLKNPNLTIDDVLKIMPGPDFPTGGEIIGTDGIKEMYNTGKGSFKVRGRYTVSNLSRGRTKISFFELPFHVSAEQVSEKIKKLKNQGKLKAISEYKDYSDMKHTVKYNITLKAGTNVLLALKDLFQLTPLESRFTSNNTVLDDGMPSKKGIIGLFEQFIELRKTCTRNKNKNKLDKYNTEIHKIKGLLNVILDLDKTIAIIRNAETSDEASAQLQKTFNIDDKQAEYILSMPLRRLTKSDREELMNTEKDLENGLNKLTAIMNDNKLFTQEIINDLQDTKKIIADKRRSIISDKSIEDLKNEEKQARTESKALTNSKSVNLIQFADGSFYKGEKLPKGKVLPISYVMKINANDELFALLNNGTGIKFPATYIPFNKVSDNSILGINNPEDIVAIGKTQSMKKDCGMLCVTSSGRIATLNGRIPSSSEEFNVIQLTDDEKIIYAQWMLNADMKKDLVIVSSDGFAADIPADSMRVTGFGSQGVKGISLSKGAKAVGASIVNKTDSVVSMTPLSIKTTSVTQIPSRNRGAKGVILQRLGKRSGQEITKAFGGKDILMTDKLGNEMTIPEKSPRATSGFKFPTLGLILGMNIKGMNDINDN